MKKSFTKIISFCLLFVLVLGVSVTTLSAAGDTAADKTLQTNGNGGKTDVGMWYVTYNTEEMFENNFGSGNPIMYRPLIANPDGIIGNEDDVYGIPDSSNTDEIDMHLQMLADAKVDFILYDLTNGGLTTKIAYGVGNAWIVKRAQLVSERIAVWNETHDWKIRYAVAVGSYAALNDDRMDGESIELQAQGVYEKFYMNEQYGGDNYYQLDGKPLLITHDWGENDLTKWDLYGGDKTYGNKFTIRAGQGGEPGTYGWVAEYGVIAPQDEVELIMAGWGSAKGIDEEHLRNNGQTYKTGWNTILENDLPRIVMIAAFNDFNEKMGVMPAETDQCVDGIEEKWTNEEGKLSKTMYWNMTVEGIRKIREKNGEIASSETAGLTLPMVLVIVAIVAVIVGGAVAVYLILDNSNKKTKKGDGDYEKKN